MSTCANFVEQLSQKKYNNGMIQNKTLENFKIEYSKYGRKSMGWYQRADVQKDDWRRDFLKSIMQGKSTAPIVMNRRTQGRGKIYRVIDGGHRFRAILRFMNNEYPIYNGDTCVYYDEVPGNIYERNLPQ